MYLFLLSKEHLELAVYEVCTLLHVKSPVRLQNVLLAKNIPKNQLKKISRLAYTKSCHEVLFAVHQKNILKKIKTFNFPYEQSFAVQKIVLTNPETLNTEVLANAVYHNLKNKTKPVVDLKNPKTKFVFIFADKKTFCTKELWENTEDFEKRKAHLRPEPHPSSLHPKLARCMVNLADSDEITDPFCGTGGILIEAGLMHLKMKGYDLDGIMVSRARINLDSFSLSGTVERKDALAIPKQKAIVTDMPYGRNTKVENAERLLLSFLQRTKAKKIIIGIPDFIPYRKIIKKAGKNIKKVFPIYLHKSLTKLVVVLC
ncbi:hypothetical protein C4573_04310 [Candidatus Woesearchaeota archaeon]|nr:MAG: hypothetical protein C4573_04310 [Candidatus Woesearchaeota archaeon]